MPNDTINAILPISSPQAQLHLRDITHVFTDLDGTLFAPGGTLLTNHQGVPSVALAQALCDLKLAGIEVIIVTGRDCSQGTEMLRMMNLDAFIGELGATLETSDRSQVGKPKSHLRYLCVKKTPYDKKDYYVEKDLSSCVDALSVSETNFQKTEAHFVLASGFSKSPAQLVAESGIVQKLLDAFSGRLELIPDKQMTVSTIFRGDIDVREANRFLLNELREASVATALSATPASAAPDLAISTVPALSETETTASTTTALAQELTTSQATHFSTLFTALELHDNGIIRTPAANLPLVQDVHIYHLLPQGVSKAAAVRAFMLEHKIAAENALAIGDSLSDMLMGDCTSMLVVMHNGLRSSAVQDAVCERAKQLPTTTLRTQKPTADGWVEFAMALLASKNKAADNAEPKNKAADNPEPKSNTAGNTESNKAADNAEPKNKAAGNTESNKAADNAEPKNNAACSVPILNDVSTKGM
jgi:hydroxymethylpyrimidine pyrophosphatase-like HAD family hydrolase